MVSVQSIELESTLELSDTSSLRAIGQQFTDADNRVEVNELEVTPSLEKAIHEAMNARRR